MNRGEIMTKETSFIVEFDELNDEQLKDLINYLDDSNIKRRALKSNYELLKEKDYKQALIEIKEYVKKLDDNLDDIMCYDIDRYKRDDILEIIDKYLEKSDIDGRNNCSKS